MPMIISMVACERKFFSQKARSHPSLRAFCHAYKNKITQKTHHSQLGSKVTENHYINHSKSILLFILLLQIKKTGKQKHTHRYREQIDDCKRGEVRGVEGG